ncbi:MAG: 2-iminoacetate synthase [candidate division TA06 bacterium ADurb.Bin417]|uniref:2-iminoacetate synthase n=1 Tax=candidate division TA06 bacterium ADurb.Bin417 TaxID=1852828 RepID=A0A1V5ML15_UNCT6|nr:MAG: 2-iminoacetate synthase [candidate division TA06 bacterium ADurb.Bin417]
MEKPELLEWLEAVEAAPLLARAEARVRAVFGDRIFIRGIVEFSNHCARNCFYCGLRAGNRDLVRYRMSPDEILESAGRVWTAGVRTLVLQSGDDLHYSREAICRLLKAVKERFPGMAVTLSLGERDPEDYRAFRDCGADRYLLKFETSNPALYRSLHPGQSLEHRFFLLKHLRRLGYQVGIGGIVGLPGQSLKDLAEDLRTVGDFQPEMVSFGPYLTHHQTPLAEAPNGSEALTLKMMALARLLAGRANMPVTTALATLDPSDGLTRGLRAGANVIMVNFTPEPRRFNYTIYDHKLRVDFEQVRIAAARAGRTVSMERGDAPIKEGKEKERQGED